MRGLVRSTSIRLKRYMRMKRSLIMSMEATFTPRLLSSLARSCFFTRAAVLKPVSTAMEPSFTPSDSADSSSGVSKLLAMALRGFFAQEGLLHDEGGEKYLFNTAKVFVFFEQGVHHVTNFHAKFFSEFGLEQISLCRHAHGVHDH